MSSLSPTDPKLGLCALITMTAILSDPFAYPAMVLHTTPKRLKRAYEQFKMMYADDALLSKRFKVPLVCDPLSFSPRMTFSWSKVEDKTWKVTARIGHEVIATNVSTNLEGQASVESFIRSINFKLSHHPIYFSHLLPPLDSGKISDLKQFLPRSPEGKKIYTSFNYNYLENGVECEAILTANNQTLSKGKAMRRNPKEAEAAAVEDAVRKQFQQLRVQRHKLLSEYFKKITPPSIIRAILTYKMQSALTKELKI